MKLLQRLWASPRSCIPIGLCSQEAQLHHRRWSSLLGFPWERAPLDWGLLLLLLGLLFFTGLLRLRWDCLLLRLCQSEWGELRQGENAHLGPQTSAEDAGLWARARQCQPGRYPFGYAIRLLGAGSSQGLADHAPTCPSCVRHAPKDHILAPQAGRQAPVPHPPGARTARAASTARLSSESSTNIQCGRIWRLWRICFTWSRRKGAAETAELQTEMGLELQRPRKSSIGGKWGGRTWDQRRGWEARTGPMSLSRWFYRGRHGILQHQVLVYIPKHGELTTSYWAALTEKAPSPHLGRRRAVLAESRARGPGPKAALAAPAAPGPAAGGWECGCAP